MMQVSSSYFYHKKHNKKPFFVHPCRDYDGSVLAVFPKNQDADEHEICCLLNSEVNWYELGFVCDGRYIFSQKSLENTLLPESFRVFIKLNYLF